MWRGQLERWGVHGTAVSYDTFRSRYEKEFMNVAQGKVLILDEAHKVKNRDAKITRLVAGEAEKAAFVVAATGTPFQNAPAELLNVLQTAQVREHKVVFIAAEWEEERFGRRRVRRLVWKGTEAMRKLRSELERSWWYLRRELGDVAKNLPPLVREVYEVDGKALAKTLRAINEELAALERKYLAEDNPQQAQRVAAVRSGLFSEADLGALFPIASTLRRLLAEAKIAAAAEVVEAAVDQVGEDEGVLFFAHHEDVIKEIVSALSSAEVPHAVISGAVDSTERQRIVDRFQSGELKALVLSTRAAGEGLTLSRAGVAVFFELDWNPAVLTQAENRVMNITAQSSKLVRYVIAPHALERRMVQLVNAKAHAAEAVYANEGSVAKLSDATPAPAPAPAPVPEDDGDDDPTPPAGVAPTADGAAESEGNEEIDFVIRVADDVLLEDAAAQPIAQRVSVAVEPEPLVLTPPPLEGEVEEDEEEEEPLPPDSRQCVLPLWGTTPSLFAGTPWERCVGGGFEPLLQAQPGRGRRVWGEQWDLHVQQITSDKLYICATSKYATQEEVLDLERAYSFLRELIRFNGAPKRPAPSVLNLLKRLGWYLPAPRIPKQPKARRTLPDRRQRVGFSEIATVMGANPYKTPMELWEEKTGRRAPEPPSLAMEWGAATERQACELFLRREWGYEKLPAWRRGANYQRPAAAEDAPLAGVIDFIVTDPAGERVILEVKVSGSGVGLEQYRLQLNAQLGAMKLRKGYIVMLVSNRYFVVEEVAFDESLYEKQKQAARDFMHCVETDTPPVPPLPTEPADAGWVVTEEEGFVQLVSQAKALQAQYDAVSEQLDALRKQIRERLEASALSRVRTSAGLVELKLIESERFDTKRFKAEHPELAKQYIKTTSYVQLKLS